MGTGDTVKPTIGTALPQLFKGWNNASYRLSHYPMIKCFANCAIPWIIIIIIMDSDAFGGQRYPTFEEPDVVLKVLSFPGT